MPEPAPKNERRPANAKPDPVLAFRERYRDALHAAGISAEHTATEGWLKLYQSHRLYIRDRRRALAKDMKALAVVMEDAGLTEDQEKELNELKKASTVLRESDAAFDVQTVGPVRQPVMDCDRVRTEAINEARRIEAEAPMLQVGLEETMRLEIASVDKPTWDAESGKVTVSPGAGA